MEPLLNLKPKTDAGAVKDGSTETFMADVIEASNDRVVVVDFWAEWCGPCKQLGPALERAVESQKGAVSLVKIDIDKNPDLAREMRIQSIPAVYAFFHGRPVDGFMGAIPESQVKTFIERLVKLTGNQPVGALVADVLQQADAALSEGRIDEAEGFYHDVLAEDPRNAEALAGLIRIYVARGDAAAARDVLEQLPEDIASTPAIKAARVAVELAEQEPPAGGTESAAGELEAKVAADANDHQARYDLAVALYGQGRAEDAIDQLLEIVKRKREWNDQEARKQLVKIFDALGPTHPQTVSGRRRLSSILFS